MDILLFHTDREKLKILSFCLESQINVRVTSVHTLEKMMARLLSEDTVDLIVANESEQLSLLVKYLLSVGAQIPMILVGGKENREIRSFPGITILADLRDTEIGNRLPEMVKAHYQQKLLENADDCEYCRISVELLCDITPLADDVYVRLSNIKFVKIFNSGTLFTEQDLKRLYGVRNIDYLYIRKSATEEFVNRLRDRLHTVSNGDFENDEKLISTVAHVQEALHDLTRKIGFTPPVIELARAHVDLAVKSIGRFPRLNRIFEGSLLSNTNYTSRHSVMVAHVACAIASKLEWPSDSTFQKLTVAALLHDITLLKPEFAELQTRADLQNAKMNISEEDLRAIENHPAAAALLVDKLHEIPGDVYTVVLQHHERPDGSGFPRGIRAQAISPLAAVFIIAHELVDAHEEFGEGFNQEKFWQDKAEYYSNGTFKKIAKFFLSSQPTRKKIA